MMKKYIIAILLLASFSLQAQTVRQFLGASGVFYNDTSITVPYTTNKYLNGYRGFVAFNTDSIAQGSTNRWYTDALARAAFTGTSNRITNTSGVLDIGTDVVTLTGSQTLTNKTLTSPILNTSSTVGYVWTASNTSGAGAWAAGGGVGSGWALTGNTATDSSINFSGTTDARRYIIKTNNIAAITVSNIQTVTLASKLALNTTAGTTGNFSGQLNWGTNTTNINTILLNDQNSSALRNGIGFNGNDATMGVFSRPVPNGLMFALGTDGPNITPANSHFYLDISNTPTPSANGKYTIFNGTAKFNAVDIALYAWPSAVNTSGIMHWGHANPSGVMIDDFSASVRAGFIAMASGQTTIFSRPGFELMIGTGKDYTTMTPANSAAYVDVNNVLIANGFGTSYVAKTANYTAVAADYTIDCTSNTFTVTLPTAVGAAGRIYVIKNSGAGVITIAATSSQTIDGVTTKTLNTQYSGYTVQSDNANWKIISTF